MIKLDLETLREHYAHIAELPFYPEVEKFMSLTPDIEIDRTREQIIDEVDPQLDAAIEFLVDGEGLIDN